jgi:hypothetical protein
LGCPGFWEDGLAVVNYSGFEPATHQALYRADGVQLVQDGIVRDSVEAFGEVGVEGVFGLETDEVEDGFDGVVWRTTWAKAVGVGLEPGFPFWFQCQLDQGLKRPIEHRRNG